MTKKEIITRKAFELLQQNPDGLRYSLLIKQANEFYPDIPTNTFHGTLWNLDVRFPDKVTKPTRGHFKLIVNGNGQPITETTKVQQIAKIKEEDFYQAFADYIVNDLEECTKAIALGKSKFKDKWTTPDVIGKRVSRPSDIVTLPTEIVSAEIKINTSDLVTAFGQSCSYKLFSHKSYIVIPKTSSQEDIDRLESLSMIFGIGLILFDATNIKQPDFAIRTRATKNEPDMFYVNKYMKLVEDELWT